jgi:biotin carboxyl carrier protein
MAHLERLALMGAPSVTRIAPGAYRVEQDGLTEVVYVAGSAGDRWAFWNGAVFHDELAGKSGVRAPVRLTAPQSLFAPMPATVAKVLVLPGAAVQKGQAVVLLEAMKMELPVRAPADAVVAAVHCREGELVQAGALLVDLR